MKAHRLAKYFPLLEGEEFDLLVEDIRKHGQMEPIVTINGEILDGVNRYRACEALGIEPNIIEFDGDDPLAYVVSINVRRRHMDKSQRAMLAPEMLPEFEEQAKERQSESAKEQWSRSEDRLHPATKPQKAESWKEKHYARDDAAKVFGVSGPTIQRAKRIKKEAPEKVADIVSGKTTVAAVDAELRERLAAKAHAERKEREDAKTVKAQPKIVKEYFDALHAYRDVLKRAILSQKRQQMFSAPETQQMLRTRHEQVQALMGELEEAE